jgi:hypothetical protein
MLQQLRTDYKGTLTTKRKVLLVGSVPGAGDALVALAVALPYKALVSGPAPGAQHSTVVSTFTIAANSGTR